MRLRCRGGRAWSLLGVAWFAYRIPHEAAPNKLHALPHLLHTHPMLSSASTRTAPPQVSRKVINHVLIMDITSNPHNSQDSLSPAKAKTYISTSTPHDGPPRTNHAKARLSKPSELKTRHSPDQKPRCTSAPAQKIQLGTSGLFSHTSCQTLIF